MTAPGQGTGPGPREEVPVTPREEPHVTENDRGMPVQHQTQSPDDVPALGANAHGRDKQPTDAQPRDDASMYDGRPGEDKDREPTDMP
jgi:hypothetical protein